MNALKTIYKVIRSIIMSLIVLAIVIYAFLYVLLSIPAFQQQVKDVTCRELSTLLGGDFDVESLSIRPFSELILTEVSLISPSGSPCARIDKVAAGIDLWQLISNRKIVLNYAEIIGLDARLIQQKKNGPLNIQFLIDALSPKDKTKPPTLFDLKFRNIVVRSSKASFKRPWLTGSDSLPLPMADLTLYNLRLDLSIPTLRNDLFRFAVRNLECELHPGVNIRRFSAEVTYSHHIGTPGNDRLEIANLKFALPNSQLELADLAISLPNPFPLDAEVAGYLTPSDLKDLLPALEPFQTRWNLDLDMGVHSEGALIRRFSLSEEDSDSHLNLTGEAFSLNRPDSLRLSDIKMDACLSYPLISKTLKAFPVKNKKVSSLLLKASTLRLDLSGDVDLPGHSNVEARIATKAGNLLLNVSASDMSSGNPHIETSIEAQNLRIGHLLSLPQFGAASFSIEAATTGLTLDADANLFLFADYMEVNGQRFHGIEAIARKYRNDITADLTSEDGQLPLLLHADCHLDGVNSYIDADLQIDGINPTHFGAKGNLLDAEFYGALKLFASGNNADNITGFLKLSDFQMRSHQDKELLLRSLTLGIDQVQSDSLSLPDGLTNRELTLRSDWIDANVRGVVSPKSLVGELKHMASMLVPALIGDARPLAPHSDDFNDFIFDLNIKATNPLFDFIDSPIRPLADIPMSGKVDTKAGVAGLAFSTPHLQQGKNKLLSDIDFSASIDCSHPLPQAFVKAQATVPVKNGEMLAKTVISARENFLNADVALNPGRNKGAVGDISFSAAFARTPNPIDPKGALSAHVEFNPTQIEMNQSIWKIAGGEIDYSDKRIGVKNFLVSNGRQYVKIDGNASESDQDWICVKINDIDLSYIFGILNIEYVSFGGMASGEVVGSRLLTKTPVARTKSLTVRNLAYNGAVLGDGSLASDFDAEEKKVGIYAVIREPLSRSLRATVDGGIWVTRDSLSFDFGADKLNVRFLKPYMSAFCSDIKGRATGRCKLFGTFKDIDLTGDVVADTLSMKLDFTNTWYHVARERVHLGNGLIDIPTLTLRDDFGNRASLSGWVRHEYFHNPSFNFRVRDARHFLVYDTNEKLNPLWYGTIFGSGNVLVNGRPGLIDIDVNMRTTKGSKFCYVISDTEEVEQSSFLTFTDRRKARLEAEKPDTVPSYLHKFLKQKKEADHLESNVVLSMKGTVTQDALVTLVMDPKGGDKITATGQGALQMDYNMASNDFRMIGTYVLDEGSYNFTLQDIILKNFNIKKGSLIKFDGDPMAANLDIAATYRVNTNLTDLDKSFANDKELNRTNIPVDALLYVKGPMTHPDISFDLELPSVSSDVERKVKSIVSTNDMMSRQIIYLLALNRFYTPEYTSGDRGNNGSEFSSMASSTLSSQLSNILSQMTDKLSVAPSFRSDKGDFSDMEFDLALSSRLLNNRLLVNGNFGYRDRNTSNTQFVGDFDLEYLLNPSGNLRLKAYNHFNDQNYYLRSALTTQGVGVVFTKDFDHFLGWRRKKKILPIPVPESGGKDPADVQSIKNDSVR